VKKASKGMLYPFGGFSFWGGDSIAADKFKRRLTAILSADVEGYLFKYLIVINFIE
jgi:hypothetical protein